MISQMTCHSSNRWSLETASSVSLNKISIYLIVGSDQDTKRYSSILEQPYFMRPNVSLDKKNHAKELSLCHKIIFSNPYIFSLKV